MAPDMPHAFAYVPDIARAAVTLLDAPDDAFNQVWHVPCAPGEIAARDAADRRGRCRREAEGDGDADPGCCA